MTLTVPRHVLSDLDAWLSREWLVTNGKIHHLPDVILLQITGVNTV